MLFVRGICHGSKAENKADLCHVLCPARRRPPGAFAGNELVTSKYNLINFIPVNLYHQFKRVANMYFAALVCLQVG